MTASVPFIVSFALCLLCLAFRDGYELRKEAGKVDPANKAVFIEMFAAMLIMLLSWTVLCPADPWRIAVSAAVQRTGRALMILGIVMALAALVQLRGVEDIDHLVTTGMFSKLRHPMYVGFVLWILGWVVSFGSIAGAAATVPAVASILIWRYLEEKRMLAAYGDAYRNYRARTWF